VHGRPRYGRISVLVTSIGLTTGATVVAALGLSPYPQSSAASASVSQQNPPAPQPATPPNLLPTPPVSLPAPPPDQPLDLSVPPGSGDGRRVVFDMSEQRVWLIRHNGNVRRTYLVSGSRVDNLQAGAYEVYSRSRHAISYTGNSTMDYMVRFTVGERAAIGFHDIPVDAEGDPLQGLDELGTPTSAGCIRQRTLDAKVMWAFADVGTAVVVVD